MGLIFLLFACMRLIARNINMSLLLGLLKKLVPPFLSAKKTLSLSYKGVVNGGHIEVLKPLMSSMKVEAW